MAAGVLNNSLAALEKLLHSATFVKVRIVSVSNIIQSFITKRSIPNQIPNKRSAPDVCP